MEKELTYLSGTQGKCPHCGCTVLFTQSNTMFQTLVGMTSFSHDLKTQSGGHEVHVYSSRCPNPKCEKPIVVALIKENEEKQSLRLVHPFNICRIISSHVPEHISNDFLEASAVLPISEKASAALSRRCLQNMLNDKGITGRNLDNQIEKAIPNLPARLGENIDMIRQVGNFAAHAMKSESTGLIVDVEPEEASWNLDVLEDLFDYYYVQPSIAEEKRLMQN